MSFQEIIQDLSSKTIRLVKDGVTVPATLSYIPELIYDEQTRTEKEQTTKRKVRLIVTGKLNGDSTYQLEYTPDGTIVVASRTYKTPTPLKVTRIEMVDYSKVCLYTNNILDASAVGDTETQTLITTTPKARIQSIATEEYMPDDLQDAFSKVTTSTITKFLADNGMCPQPKPDEMVYVINTRLNPSTAYTLKFTVKDMYGNVVAPITKTFTTGKIKDKDKFLYIGYPEKNTIPSDVPLIVNIQSINTSKVSIAVCAMDVEMYLKSKHTVSTDNQLVSPGGCDQSFTKDITVKNNNRLLSNTHIDLEKDI
ncbi:MAG: hypothetical protein WCJ45_01045 [bacterium]